MAMDTGKESLPGEADTLWIATTPKTAYPSLSGEISVDVAVVGGGIVGLTAAVLLKKSGATVAVLESNEIARGVSGHTTAKITSAHGLIYNYLVKYYKEEKAHQYAEANQGAIEFIASYIRENGISCDFHRTSACTFSPEEKDRQSFQDEVEAAAGLGLPVRYTESAPVPFPVRGAICYENQAFFHPRKYLLALAERIPGNGSHLFEHTRVKDVNGGSPCSIATDRGTLKAGQVIVATHFPILNRGLFFAKMIPRRAYLMALKINGEAPEGMYYGIAPPYHTIRKHVTETGEATLLIGGEDHITGHRRDTLEPYRRLIVFARKNFEVQSVLYHWSTQDNDPFDRIPFIGHHSFFSRRIFVATGFSGWGMTNGTAAAMILSDLLSGRSSPWSPVFNPSRSTPYRSKKFFFRNMSVSGTLIRDYLPAGRRKPISDLVSGEAAIVDKDGKEVAAFRDEQGRFHTVTPRCTHMFCKVEWNEAEKSWDCPCHGSRFEYGGKVLHAPATQDLEQK